MCSPPILCARENARNTDRHQIMSQPSDTFYTIHYSQNSRYVHTIYAHHNFTLQGERLGSQVPNISTVSSSRERT
jgi:hypothetical protein